VDKTRRNATEAGSNGFAGIISASLVIALVDLLICHHLREQ
jgi:hypothetical protein